MGFVWVKVLAVTLNLVLNLIEIPSNGIHEYISSIDDQQLPLCGTFLYTLFRLSIGAFLQTSSLQLCDVALKIGLRRV